MNPRKPITMTARGGGPVAIALGQRPISGDSAELHAYVSGEIGPQARARISIEDRSIMYGDSVFEVLRTFGGVPFRKPAHLERLSRSLRYVEMEKDEIRAEVDSAIDHVVEVNRESIRALGDVWIDVIVSRGRDLPVTSTDDWEPTIIVKVRPLAFEAFAGFYDRGADLHVSLATQHFAGTMDRRVKAANRLAAMRGELKGRRLRKLGESHWTVAFNADGSVAETHEANICVITGSQLVRPPRHEALEGVSLETLCELAEKISLVVKEGRLSLYDILNSDTTLITATSFCLLPVRSIDGIMLSSERLPYELLRDEWVRLVGLDFVEQARERGKACWKPE